MDKKAMVVAILGSFLIFLFSFAGWSGAWVSIFNFNVSYMTVFTVSSIVYVLIIIAKVIFVYIGSRVLNNLFVNSCLKHQIK